MRPNLLCLIAACAGAVVAVFSVLVIPAVFLAIPAVAALAAMTHPVGRVLVVLLGGLFVLQSSQGLSPPKLAYLAAVVIAAALAWRGATEALRSPWGKALRPAMQGAGLLLLLIVVQAAVGLAQPGTSASQVGRDAITYLLVCAAPVIALDAARVVSVKMAERILVGITLLAAVGFAVAWIQRRGIGVVEVNQFLLASVMLLAPGVAYGVARAYSPGSRRVGWLALSSLLIIGVIITGTRSGLVLVGAIPGVLGASRKARVPAGKLFRGSGGIAMIIAIALPVAANALGLSAYLTSRLAVAQQALSGGWASDNSGAIRLAASRICLNLWHQHELFGVGFGQTFPDPNIPGKFTNFQLDSPYLFLAKFGLLGSLMLFVALGLLVQPAFRAARIGEHRIWVPGQTAMRGAVTVWLLALVFGAFTEDKGFAFSIPIMLMLVGAQLRARAEERAPDEATEPAPSSRLAVRS